MEARKSLVRIADYQQLFNSPIGKKVLHDLMKVHGFMRISHSEDSHDTAFREGERSVVVRILNILKMDLNQIEERIKSNEDSY